MSYAVQFIACYMIYLLDATKCDSDGAEDSSYLPYLLAVRQKEKRRESTAADENDGS